MGLSDRDYMKPKFKRNTFGGGGSSWKRTGLWMLIKFFLWRLIKRR